jgi:DmsE family decaheme c-type cytochrome
MSRSLSRLLAASAAVGFLLLTAALLCLPYPSEAQQPPPKPAAAAPAAVALPQGYAGADACKQCHEDQFKLFEQTKMGRLFLKHPRNAEERLACETCHGPGKAHVDAGGGKGVGNMITFAKNDKTPVDKRNASCLSCHTKGARLFWQGSAHETRDVACTSCHKVMTDVSPRAQLAKPNEIDTCGQCHLQRRAQTMRSSHMPLREGKMTCTSCHNPHGTVTPALLKENSVNDTCFTCHAEKRGPFLNPHAPVVESCSNCHDPHGSNHERMLKVAKPRLCQECHDTSRHPTNAYGRESGANIRYVMGRACASCHVTIHGSNHPNGHDFTR